MDILPVVAMVVSSVSLVVSTYTLLASRARAKAAADALSVDVFLNILKELGEKDLIHDRHFIMQNIEKFPDCTSEDCVSDEEGDVGLWISSSPSQKKIVKVKKLSDTEKEILEDVARGFDRVGFMLYDLELSSEHRDRYFKWLCAMTVDMWNKVAAHIGDMRKKRASDSGWNVSGETLPSILFAPNFEKLAYGAFDYYKKARQDARIAYLNPTCGVSF
jgi:hypothetical protein